MQKKTCQISKKADFIFRNHLEMSVEKEEKLRYSVKESAAVLV